MYIIFDTETTGLPRNWNAPYTDTDNWPRCIQIAWQLHDDFGNLIEHKDYLVKPNGFDIPFDAERIHGISTELAINEGADLDVVLTEFNEALAKAKFVVGQNVKFDNNVMGCEFHRQEIETELNNMPVLDTCTEVTAKLCKIPGGRGGKFKLPTLTELHQYLFQVPFGEAHNATADVEATTRCFLELIRLNIFSKEDLNVEQDYFKSFQEVNPSKIDLIGLKHINLKNRSKKYVTKEEVVSTISSEKGLELLKDAQFSHLHNHTQFSILQSTTEVEALVKIAIKQGAPAVALTDSGNMMAAYHFVRAGVKHNKAVKAHLKDCEESGEFPSMKEIKPIVGSEFFVCKNHTDKTHKDNGYQIPMLALNKRGYHNLAKMSSIGNIDGFYYVPRIDKDVLAKYSNDIVVTTGGLNGEVPNLILNVGEKQAEEALLWYKETFKENFYIEIVRHHQEDEDRVNSVLLRFAKKHHIKYIATNNTFYLKKEDAVPHDILLCVKEGEKQSTPIGRGRGFRFGFPNQEYYFKSADEMKDLFKDIPDAILNIQEIVDKIVVFDLARDVLLPAFDIPEEFKDEKDEEDGGKRGENNFLRHLTYLGAEKRYPDLTDDIKERLDFELQVIANTGYPGYFLIVQDFTAAARDMGVSVGPGRGSAAGSAVAYCTGITNVDPIKYDLLFERFLNPDRVSLPDIDIDFDDEGRGRVIDWVIDKYGENQVAQIITYGTMAAKSSIRDTARVLDLALPEADRLAKLVPDIKLKKLFGLSDEELNAKLNPEQMEMANQLLDISEGDDLTSNTLNTARSLEGSVRNTGIHACGVIITPDDITKFVPVARAKDTGMFCTQFDNSVVEDAGLLKMDFLGLKTLTLIKDAVRIVKERHGIVIDPEELPLDDVKTYELFQRGETVGVFQYESPGMQKYLRELKPTEFSDLIAMNALYRPGPLEYIPSFIRRKHGEEEITYDLEGMDEYLEETYGITVYQEQVMLLSQKLAGFTKGEADMLRKAMGKKIFSLLEQMKPKFISQGMERGHKEKMLEKVWKDWEAFASYAFNKSHSTCYAWIAYQTAYFKAHYPAEYMASVLSNNMNDIKSVTFFMEECRRAEIPVLGPDVNESNLKFTVNQKGEIRFGLQAMKGVGEGAVLNLIKERTENGPYKDVFDFAQRVELRAVNKRVFENLAMGGGFDSFTDTHRAQYFALDQKGRTTIESIIKFGANFQESKNSSQVSMFGESSDVDIPTPEIQDCEKWSKLEALSKEKEIVGIFISGHPLDEYKLEFEHFCNASLEDLNDLESIKSKKEIKFGGVLSEVLHKTSKNGNPYGMFIIEDYTTNRKFMIFSDDYLRIRQFLVDGLYVHVTGSVEKRWNQDKLEFKISKMELLSKLRDKLAKKIVIHINQNLLDNYLINELETISEEFTGDKKLAFEVVDEAEKVVIKLLSKSKGVSLSNEFIDKLESLQNVKYSLV